MSKRSNQESSSEGAYDAFAQVDQLVAKPVLGSDGAANWQNFQKSSKKLATHTSYAPQPSLKASDRAAGFSSWNDERVAEQNSRAGQASVGYTHFAERPEIQSKKYSKKERKRVQQKIMPHHLEYFVASPSFTGWKWDYVFTTRDQGTGYYFDGSDSVKELQTNGEWKRPPETDNEPQAAATTPPPNDTDHTILATTTTTQDPSPEKKKKKRKNTQNQPSTNKFINDPNHPQQVLATARAQHDQWHTATDHVSGKQYWYHGSSGVRTWDDPTKQPKQQQQQQQLVLLPDGWNSSTDPASGKVYYYHTDGRTRWDQPRRYNT